MSTTPERIEFTELFVQQGASSMPHAGSRIARSRAPSQFWNLPYPDEIDATAVPRGAPPIDDSSTAIDELAFLLATDHLSTLEKIGLLEQWRYDVLLLDVASGEGFGSARDDGVLLQQISKALLLLARHRFRH
jgi:hypothetical protein